MGRGRRLNFRIVRHPHQAANDCENVAFRRAQSLRNFQLQKMQLTAGIAGDYRSFRGKGTALLTHAAQ
jgi:hypothetical protein